MKKKIRQFTELVVFVLIILSLGMSCQTHGEITNTRVPPTAPTQPDSAVMILLERGSDHLQAADYDLAIASFDKAIELDPTLFLARVGRAATHNDHGDFQLASGPISFNIGTVGNIHNLESEIYFGEEGSCIVNADEVLVEANNTFSYQRTKRSDPST